MRDHAEGPPHMVSSIAYFLKEYVFLSERVGLAALTGGAGFDQCPAPFGGPLALLSPSTNPR